MNKGQKIALWVSVGVVGIILSRVVYKTIRRKATITDGNTTLDNEMKTLVEQIKNAKK